MSVPLHVQVAELRREVEALKTARLVAEVYGTVVNVEIRKAETELASDHSSGVTVLHVLDVSELTAAGTVNVAADDLAYTSITDLGPDSGPSDTPTITLTTPTATGYDAGAAVVAVPAREHKVALVAIPGLPEPVEALLKGPHHHVLDEGQRSPEAGETVLLVQRGRGLVVEDILGRPQIDAAYLKPGTASPSVLNLSTPAMAAGWATLVRTITGDLTDIDGGTP